MEPVILGLKLLLAPALVVLSSLAGRRWGPAVTGVLIALPMVAGPILLLTYLDHGAAFAAHAAAGALLGLGTLALFAVVLTRAGGRFPWTASLAITWGACLVADLTLSTVDAPPAIGLPIALAATAAARRRLADRRAAPRSTVASPVPAAAATPGWPWWDLPARALATAVLVLMVTGSAAALGPQFTGVLAPFPIATSVVAGFTLARQGPAATRSLLRGLLDGMVGFALFCFLVAVLLERLGGPVAFTCAFAAAPVAQLALRRLTPQPDAPVQPRPEVATEA